MFLRRSFREQRATFRPQTPASALILPIGCLYIAALCFAPAARAQNVPQYKVDASWPKPLPNNWTIGGIGGLAVDKDDHIWVYHRPSTITPVEAGAEQNPPASIC